MVKLVEYLGRLVSGLRFRLLVLLVLACAPLVALTLHSAGEARRHASAGWRQRAEKVAEEAAGREEELVGGTRQLLLALAQSAPIRGGNLRASQKLMEHLFSSYPRYANLGVLSTNGRILACAVPITNATSFASQKFFVRAMTTHRFSVGDFARSEADARPIVSFGLPVLTRERDPLVVVFAALDLDWYQGSGAEKQPQLPPGAAWFQVARDGTLIAGSPGKDSGLKLGERFQDRSLLVRVFSRPEGVIEAPGARGVPTVYAFAQVPSQFTSRKVATVLSIPRQALFAEADRQLFRNLSWLSVATAVAVLVGWIGSKVLILRPVHALAESSARLARGDLAARTGLSYGRDELGRLTQAFDQMAHKLEQREKERLRSRQKLQVLSRRLVEVQECERRLIARELHDEVGQSLTAAQLSLQGALADPNGPSLKSRLEMSAEMIQRVLEQVQDMSLSLRPSLLDDLGLESALRWYVNRHAEMTGMRAEFDADPLEGRLDSLVETECFRVAQEALTNVARHAKAHTVTLRLRANGSHLQLTVHDDGVGFDVPMVRDQAVRGDSLGVLSMEERAGLAGGGLQIDSAPGLGTAVRAWFPLKWREAQT